MAALLWLDGKVRDGTRAEFDLADRGLTLGDGVFDTALVLNGRVAFAEAHGARLVANAESLGITADPGRIAGAMAELAAAVGQGSLRTTLTRGSGPRGLRPPARPSPLLFATATPATAGLAFAPMRLWPTVIARNETSLAARVKSLGYLDAVMAAREAELEGFDDALFRNTRGRIACAGTGNLFALFGTRLVTPPLGDGVLAGIVRGVLREIAPDCGLAPEEGSLGPDDLDGADAVFLTNSLRLLAPVEAVGGARFAGAAHPAFAALRGALRARVARDCGVSPEAVA